MCFYSSYEGWDNPFRPEGEISHDAEELLKLWRLGKLEEQNRKNSQSNNNNNDSTSKTETPSHTNGQVTTSNLENTSGSLPQQNGGHKNGVTPTSTSGGTTFDVVGTQHQQQHQLSQPVTINDTKGDNSNPPKKKTEGCCTVM